VFVIIELLTLEFTFLMLAAGTVVGGLGVNLLGGPGGSRSSPPRPSRHCCSSRSGRCCCARCIDRATQPTNVDACTAGGRVTAPFVDDVAFGAPRQRRAVVRDPSARATPSSWATASSSRRCAAPRSRSRPRHLPPHRQEHRLMVDIGAFAGQIFVIVLLVVIAIFVIVVLFRSIRIIPQAYTGVVERLGRYQRTLSPA
jgi:hypothetical protein